MVEQRRIAELEALLVSESKLRKAAEVALQRAQAHGSLGSVPPVKFDEHLPVELVDRAGRLEVVGTLAAGIAHDFNNVLSAVTTAMEIICRTSNEPRTRMLAIQSQEAAARAARLVSRLLHVARGTNADEEVKRIDVSKLVNDPKEFLQVALGSEVKLEISASLKAAVAINPHQFEVALLNLAVNSKAAMPRGGTFRVNVSRCQATGDEVGRYVLIEVRDSGVGMDEETVGRARMPFFTTKRNGEGTGLGLSMVDATVREAGGFMEIKSLVGKGTVVGLFLPEVE